MLDGEHFSRAAETRLNLVDDQQHAVLVADAPQHREKSLTRDAVSPFPLNRLDQDRSHFLGWTNGREQSAEIFLAATVRQPMHTRQRRSEAALMNRLRT